MVHKRQEKEKDKEAQVTRTPNVCSLGMVSFSLQFPGFGRLDRRTRTGRYGGPKGKGKDIQALLCEDGRLVNYCQLYDFEKGSSKRGTPNPDTGLSKLNVRA